MSQAFRIPTIVPRDLLPRPETTLLRVVVTSAIPVLVMFALVMKGVPAEWLLVVLMMIISQVSMAVTQAQKEMLAASSSYFRPGLGRRVAMAQLAWGLALPAAATLALALLGGDRQPALLGSAFGLAMLVHALMAWATLRMWWAFQLPVWAFYFFFIPMAIRKSSAAAGAVAASHLPAVWLVAGGAALVLLVRYAGSRALQRRLHDTIVLGPEAIFSPRRVQQYKQQSRRVGLERGGAAWRTRTIASLIGRAEAAGRRGDRVGARTWQLLAADFAVNFSPRAWVVPLFSVLLLAMMVVFGYYRARGDDGLDQVWFSGLVFQSALFPMYSMAMVLLAAPLAGLSRRTGFAAEQRTVGLAAAASLAFAALLLGVGLVLEMILPAWDGGHGPRVFLAPPAHGLLVVPLTTSFAWLAVALRPRAQCTLTNAALVLAFFLGHALLTHGGLAWAAPAYVGLSLAAAAIAFLLRRRWWQRRDLPA